MLMQPVRDRATKQYSWPKLEVKRATNPAAGFGLFATRDLPELTIIPYIGNVLRRRLTDEEFEKNVYLVEVKKDEWYIDGTPEKAGVPGCKGQAIAAFANEPSAGQTVNAVLQVEDLAAYIVLQKAVGGGEEILISYNFDRQTKRAYKTSL